MICSLHNCEALRFMAFPKMQMQSVEIPALDAFSGMREFGPATAGILDLMPDAIILFNSQSKIVYLNKACSALFGGRVAGAARALGFGAAGGERIVAAVPVERVRRGRAHWRQARFFQGAGQHQPRVRAAHSCRCHGRSAVSSGRSALRVDLPRPAAGARHRAAFGSGAGRTHSARACARGQRHERGAGP